MANGKINTIHNATPCCNAATHMQHEKYSDDHELDWRCKECGREYHVTFENVSPLKGCGVFRKLTWTLTAGAGGRELDDRES